MIKWLSFDEIKEILHKFKDDGYRILSPVKNKWGDWFPEEIIPDGWPSDFKNYFFPFLKDFVFPQEEPLFKIGERGFEELYDDVEPTVFFGVRPCDVTALSYTDYFYTGREFVDERYKRRREKLVVIAVVCLKSCEASFCHIVEAGPWAKEGFDIQLFLDGERWLGETGTERGEEILKYTGFDAGEEELEKLKEKILREFKKIKIKPEYLFYRKNEELEKYLGDRCFGCGGCVWLCPTCTCYTERPLHTGGLMREQDACLLAGYHRMAKGFSLRPAIYQRISYRFECKLGVGRCVGCGRCSVTCIGYAAMEAYFERVQGYTGDNKDS